MTHNIGRAIFVFAGGSFPTWAKFEARARPLEDKAGPAPLSSTIKGPDFLSRLQGFMDIKPLDYEAEIETKNEIDAAVALRRAMVLRQLLKKSNPGLAQTVHWGSTVGLKERLNVDLGVVDAFLKVQKYNYGLRSMDAIVKMSAINEKNGFDWSGLAPQSQLQMHLEANDFLAIVRNHVI